MKPRRRSHAPAFALVLVLVAVATTSVVLLALQSSALRQSSAGREAVAKLRAKWAARAGLEATIARFERATESPDLEYAFRAIQDMTDVSKGNLLGASWIIASWDGDTPQEGPADAHAKVNIALMTQEDLMELEGMTEDVAGAILDWVDSDSTVSELGAEEGFYSQLDAGVVPRNAPPKNMLEIELIAGVDPELLRGEDWNLNGILDPNEDDGELTWPPDNADGILDAGWSAIITTESVDLGLAASGEPRLFLKAAEARDLQQRVAGLSPLQAQAILQVAQGDTTLEQFIASPLPNLAQQTGVFSQTELQTISALETDQIAALLNECTLRDPIDGPAPGKINLNSVRREILEYIQPVRDSIGFAELIMLWRDTKGAQGFTSILDLLEYLPSPQAVASLAEVIGVHSNAYVVVSKGRDIGTGIEVEIRATIERTALPIVITELVVR